MTGQINSFPVDPTSLLPSDWVEDVIIRPMEESDLPALEWNGEYTHFRRMYADAFKRQQRGFSILRVADLPGSSIIR